MIRRAIFLVSLVLTAASAFAQSGGYLSVASPNGAIEFRLFNAPPDRDDSALPRLAYWVTYEGKALIETSSLGYDIEDQVTFGEKLSVIATTRDTVDETYTLPHGKASRVRNHYNSLLAELLQEGSQGRMLAIEVRAYDDGVAFRYHVSPSATLMEMRIVNERTQFQLARDATVYAQTPADFHLGYEDEYHRHTLSGIHSDAPIALPLLAEVPGVAWVGITEANVDDYPNLYLQHTHDRFLAAHLAPMLDGSGLAGRRGTPFASPWRVLLIGDTPAAPTVSNILTSLNEPSTIGDRSWIRTTETRSADAWVTEDWITIEANYEKSFPQYQARGVRGVVITNILREDQATQSALRRVFAKAAEHRLMLKLHDVAKPDGSERTFPNVVVREAAITNEHAQWGARANPDHNVLLAFTRLMAGPVDYQPGEPALSRVAFVPGEGVLGTAAHQAALEVVFGGGAWDETRAVAGDPESYFAIARRKGNDWWLAVINNWTARKIDLPLAFLGSGEYTTEVESDSPVRQSASDAIGVDLASGGGLLIHFKK